MAKIATFPIRVRVQSVEVKIYREKAKTTKSGYTYCVSGYSKAFRSWIKAQANAS